MRLPELSTIVAFFRPAHSREELDLRAIPWLGRLLGSGVWFARGQEPPAAWSSPFAGNGPALEMQKRGEASPEVAFYAVPGERQASVGDVTTVNSGYPMEVLHMKEWISNTEIPDWYVDIFAAPSVQALLAAPAPRINGQDAVVLPAGEPLEARLLPDDQLVLRFYDQVGWTAVARQSIPKGTYISAYIGQVTEYNQQIQTLPGAHSDAPTFADNCQAFFSDLLKPYGGLKDRLSSESQKRLEHGLVHQSPYCLAMDFDVSPPGSDPVVRPEITIDSLRVGNFSRFFAGSTDEQSQNLDKVFVVCERNGVRFPLVVYLANRLIDRGEKLSCDYGYLVDDPEMPEEMSTIVGCHNMLSKLRSS
jgi:hypothetical protein